MTRRCTADESTDGETSQHPGRRRPAGEAARLPDASSRSWGRTSSCARSGEEALREILQTRLRGHPARRQHARHGRLRDGRADPPATSDRRTRRSSSSPPTPTRCRPRAATRSARSTTSSSPVVPDVLRTKVRVFVELYLTQRVRRQAEERVALAAAEAARHAPRRTPPLASLARGEPRARPVARPEVTRRRPRCGCCVPRFADSAPRALRRPAAAARCLRRHGVSAEAVP